MHAFHGGIRFSPFLEQTEDKSHCLTGRGVTTNSVEADLRMNRATLEKSRHAINDSLNKLNATKYPGQIASQR